ncbi:holo-ACP synthase [Alloscardovia venturai]|uniref:Holo-[acyl-carrier-protein] synthase n=1 Tax=Alloscardovia venturai TaxID=1769421 RepID=A0ABW2Y3E1_9BIFI
MSEDELSTGLGRLSCIAGMGHDVVSISDFQQQLNLPGSRFENLFSSREKAQCRAHSGVSLEDYARHLAVRWAGKEAFLKAWSHALVPQTHMPYSMEAFPWNAIEILSDSVRRPSIFLSSDVMQRLTESLGQSVTLHTSLSHDGNVASAVVLLEANAGLRYASKDIVKEKAGQ